MELVYGLLVKLTTVFGLQSINLSRLAAIVQSSFDFTWQQFVFHHDTIFQNIGYLAVGWLLCCLVCALLRNKTFASCMFFYAPVFTGIFIAWFGVYQCVHKDLHALFAIFVADGTCKQSSGEGYTLFECRLLHPLRTEL
jgi:hypothetical protein